VPHTDTATTEPHRTTGGATLAMISNRIKVRPFLRIALAGVGLCFIYYLGVRTWELARIFYGHPGLELTQGEVAEAYKERDLSIPAPIPKIIHQIFHNWTDADNEHIPEEYALQRQTCIDANPGWENRVCILALVLIRRMANPNCFLLVMDIEDFSCIS
jgi:hypothetical protein